MEDERDFVTFTDDDGNEFELDVIDYFEYEDEEYAVLMDLSSECEDEECDCEHDVYIMKIITEGDEESFVPADEDKFDVLAAIAEERLNSECDCDDDECCCDDECDCSEHEHEHGHCDCGCNHEK